MTWSVEWSHAATAALRAIPCRDAARIDAAVQRLAKEQKGDIVRVKDHPTAARLRVAPYVVYLNFDRFNGILGVWYIYRA
jgi:mRNA-degrading endonuclease RelE of RelBE toxin-antitoxin system